MKTLFWSAVAFTIIYIHLVGATPFPQSTADELIFCCTDDDDVKKPGTMDRVVSSLGSKNRVRISQQKCLEHSAIFCPEPDTPIVGVIGGITVTDPGAFPHMVALGWRLTDNAGFSWLCGGSLVSEFYVLTAAHCTFSRNAGLVSGRPEIIRLGELDFTKDDTELQDIQIQSIIVHPEYRSPTKYHDIALLRLATPAKLTDFVRPVCLWQNETMEQTIAKAIGWGRTSQVGSGSVTLQSVDLSFFTNQQCRESFGVTRTMKQGVIPQQLCAGNSDGGKDTCSLLAYSSGDRISDITSEIEHHYCRNHVTLPANEGLHREILGMEISYDLGARAAVLPTHCRTADEPVTEISHGTMDFAFGFTGDSGGPLTVNLPTNRLNDCVHHQVGITSFGIGCGSTSPAVYTRVSQYLDWIEKTVWP